MRLLDAAFDVLRRAGEPLSPAEIVRQIKSARIQIDTDEPLDDETVKVELEHVAKDGSEATGIVQTPSGRFTLPSMLDRTVRTGTSIAATTASTINPISIASAIARSHVGAVWTVQDATKEILNRAKRPLSISEMTTMLQAAGVLKGTRSKDESEVRSQLIQDMLQHGRESAFVRVGNNTYALRYYSNEDASEPETVAFEAPELESVSPSRLGRVQDPSSDLLRQIRGISNQRFERFIVVFLASLGMTDVEVLNRMRRGELDIHARMSVADVMEIPFTIQALNWNRDVHAGDVQLLRGGMRIGDHGLMVTTSDFQQGHLTKPIARERCP